MSNIPATVPVFPTFSDDVDDILADNENNPNAEISALATLVGMIGSGLTQGYSQDMMTSIISNNPTVTLSFIDVNTVRASAGIAYPQNAAGTQRLIRKNTGTTDITFSNIDTGARAANTQYYIYAKGDALANSIAFVISASASAPTGVTRYQLVGGFRTATASTDIDSLTVYSVARTFPLFHFRDEKAANTAGGTFTSGAWRTRDLNTVKCNEIAGASLASNQFTLPAGTYRIEAAAPATKTNAHKAKLYNITDSADVIIGTNGSAWSGGETGSSSFVKGRFTITGTKVFEIQHECVTTQSTNGFGELTNFGVVEVFAEVMIWKIA